MKSFFKLALLAFVCFHINTCYAQKDIQFKLIDNQKMIEILNNKQKADFEQNDLAYIKDLKSFIDFNKSTLSVPDYFIYNKDGYLINSDLDKEECGSLIRTFDENLFNVDKNDTLKSFLDKIDFLDKNQELANYDFVVFITWADFAHRLSNQESFDNYTYIKKNYDDKVKVFLLNLDINESWNLTQQQKEILGL